MTTHPGLDITALRSLRPPRRSLAHLKSRIEFHLDDHEGYIAFSGGKDSLVALDLARQVDPEIPVVFFDSGLEYPETYTYLDQLAHRWNLNLQVIYPKLTALEVLALSGHWTHCPTQAAAPDLNLHQILITDPAKEAHDLYGPGEIWGVRSEESRGRAIAYAVALKGHPCSCCTSTAARRLHHGGCIVRKDATVAYGPVWDWKTHEIWSYIAANRLPLNPVYGRLRAIGAPETFLRVAHMVDGARVGDGRMVWLKRGWPALFDELSSVLPRIREFV